MPHSILLALVDDQVRGSFRTAAQAAGFSTLVAEDPQRPLEGLPEGSSVAVLVQDAEALEGPLGSFLGDLTRLQPMASCILVGGGPPGPVGAGCSVRHVDCDLPASLVQERLEQAMGDFRARRAEGLYRVSEDAASSLDEATVRRLYRLTRSLSGGVDLDAIAQRAAEALHDLLPGRGCHVQLWDPGQAEACAEFSVGPEMGCDLYRLPLEVRMGRIGEVVLDATSASGDGMGDGEESLLVAVVSPVMAAAEVRLQHRERDRAQEATLLAMARIADMRDNETGQHLTRVSRYSVLIAEAMREDGALADEITDQFISDLYRCAPLHDLGKVAIPDAILLKSGHLSKMEWELMKSHPAVGAQILDQLMQENPVLRFVSMGRDIALCHHEKFDGSGYPAGLSGSQIPLSARIVALADMYDALTSERSYKSAWSHEKSLEYLRDLSGSHLDPRVLAAFLAREDQIDEIRLRLADDPLSGPEDARHAA